MRAREGTLLLICIGLIPPSQVCAQVEGTYRFVVCEGECISTDSIGPLASGEIVLFPDSTFVDGIPIEALETLRRRSTFLLYRQPGLNACFRFNGRESREVFAGIIQEGLTHWGLTDGEISFALYRSPDGHFTVYGTVENGRILGRGAQAHGMAPPPLDRAFLADRLGPPDASRCVGGGVG